MEAGPLALQGESARMSLCMDPIVLSLRECPDGWRIFQGEAPLFWFQAYDQALSTARLVASIQVEIREAATCIVAQRLGEKPVLVSKYEPVAA